MYLKAVGLKKLTKTIKISEKSKEALDKISIKQWQYSDSDIISNNLEILNSVLNKIDTVNTLLGLCEIENKNIQIEDLVNLYGMEELGNIATLNTLNYLDIDYSKSKKKEIFLNIKKNQNENFKYFVQKIVVTTVVSIRTAPWGGSQLVEDQREYSIFDYNFKDEIEFINKFWKELLEFTINKAMLKKENMALIK